MGLARKITISIISLLTVICMLIGTFSFQSAYRQTMQSAGIEVVGCANITTGLVDPAIIQKLLMGDQTVLAEVEHQLDWTVDHKDLFKETFILSLDGTILAADSNLKARGYEAGDSFYLTEEDREMIRSMKHGVYSDVYTYDGTKLLTGYAPIFLNHDPSQEIVGLMTINFDASIIDERTWEIITLPFVIGASIFLIGALIAYFFIHRMIRPLEILSGQVKKIAAGDLTVTPPVIRSKDEVGQLASNIGLMTTNLRQIITEVIGMSLQVSSSSQQLSASADQTTKASEQTALITEELSEGTRRQLSSLDSSNEAIREMSDAIMSITKNTEEVVQATAITSKNSQEGNHSLKETVNQIEIVEEKINDLSTIIQTLSSHSQEIKGILDIIREISTETNLLALNAAIEAARAGDEGRGFAVVAGSIRKLAERSIESTHQITELVEEIVGQMELSEVKMDSTLKEVTRSSELVHNAEAAFIEIEQSAAYAAESMDGIASHVSDLSNRSAHLVRSTEEILSVANYNAEHAENVSAASEQQLAAMQQVGASAALLSELSEKLQHMIERFKV